MSDHMGTRFLQQTLNEQLGKHIQEKLPGLRTGLQSKIQEINDKLKTMGYYDESEKNKIKLLYKLINQFVEALRTSLEGNTINVSGSTLKTGANINYTIYNDVYSLIQSSVSIQTLKTLPYLQSLCHTLLGKHGAKPGRDHSDNCQFVRL